MMYRKVILSLVFIAFVSLQMANSLQCYQCHDAVSCRNPTTVVCDQLQANATQNVSSAYYQDVQLLNSNNYSCFISAYNFTNVTVVEMRGCIVTGAINCKSKLFNVTLTTDTCKVCQKDLCNIRNTTNFPIDFINNSTQNNNNTNNNNNNIPPHNNNTYPIGSDVANPSSSIATMICLLIFAKVFVI